MNRPTKNMATYPKASEQGQGARELESAEDVDPADDAHRGQSHPGDHVRRERKTEEVVAQELAHRGGASGESKHDALLQK